MVMGVKEQLEEREASGKGGGGGGGRDWVLVPTVNKHQGCKKGWGGVKERREREREREEREFAHLALQIWMVNLPGDAVAAYMA